MSGHDFQICGLKSNPSNMIWIAKENTPPIAKAEGRRYTGAIYLLKGIV